MTGLENINPKSTALITGGAQRIGKAIALALAADGYDIALHYHRSESAAKETAAQINALGRQCSLFQCDLSDIPQAQAMVGKVFKQCPGCNVLVNNASIFEKKSFLDTEEEFFDRFFDLNFKSPFFVTQAFAKRCREGNVINLLDTKAHRTVTAYFAYTLTKKALVEFTRMAAKTLAPGVRVNGVAPGLILPPEGEGGDYMDRMKTHIPLQRKGEPEAIARAVLFLLNNDFITGECITVDGGEHLKA